MKKLLIILLLPLSSLGQSNFFDELSVARKFWLAKHKAVGISDDTTSVGMSKDSLMSQYAIKHFVLNRSGSSGTSDPQDLQGVTDYGYETTNPMYSKGDLTGVWAESASNSLAFAGSFIRSGQPILQIGKDSAGIPGTAALIPPTGGFRGDYDVIMPNASGRLVYSVNGIPPNDSGNVTVSVSGGSSGVSSFNGRTGAVTPDVSDYTGMYPLISGTYNNPSWLNQLAWSKITGAPSFITSYTETDPVWIADKPSYLTSATAASTYSAIGHTHTYATTDLTDVTTWTDYSSTTTTTGWSSFTTKKVQYSITGKTMTVMYNLTGVTTIGSTVASFTLPFSSSSFADTWQTNRSITATTNAAGVALVSASSSTVNLYPSAAAGNWQSSSGSVKTAVGVLIISLP